ncbi:MAG: hypothetical protein Q9181_004406 [Wetmoreana brouardii]
MALRLQSNLLYGVSRVYLQQCGYTLADAQSVQANMRVLSRIIRTASLDPNAGKARPDQLVLEDDPAFVTDMVLPGLDIDLAALDITTDVSSRRSSLLSPPSQRTSLSSQQTTDESMLGLQIPTSDEGGDLGGFIVPPSGGASVGRGTGFSELRREGEERIREDEDDFILDPVFMLDDEGNLVVAGEDAPASQAQPLVGRIRSDSAASAHVRRELEEGMQAGQAELRNMMDVDLDFHRGDDDDLLLPPADPFPPGAAQGAGLLRSSAVSRDESSSEAAAAPQQRKRRGPKVLPVDVPQELRNTILAQWNNDYLANMEEAKKSKLQRKTATSAKQNAAFWVYGAGIGGVGVGGGVSNMKGPLADMFSGDALMQAFIGPAAFATGKKRSRSEDIPEGSESEQRRVKMRASEEEVGRAQGLTLEDDDTMALPGSEAIELGRHAQPALDDTSQFPWNRSASARGSRSRQSSLARGFAPGFGSSIGGFATSGGRPSSLPLGPSSLDRRGSRITSASPLIGRGGPQQERYKDLEVPQFDDNELLGGPSTSVAGDDFQLYGPTAGVDTQTAAQSQWIRKTLDTESNNFLEFIKAEVAAKADAAAEEEELGEEAVAGVPKAVSFEELLPPERNSKIVAAQGLLHTLTLATKGLIKVEQEEDYGAIDLRVVGDV